MANLFDLLGGLIGRGTQMDPTPEASPVTLIPGAQNAKELCMLAGSDTSDGSGYAVVDWLRDAEYSTGKRIVQLKADGIRAIYIDGNIYTREGAIMDCARHCVPGIQRMLERAGCPNAVVDGEYQEEGGFNATLNAFKRKNGEGVFWAFDFIDRMHWASGAWHCPIETRLAALKEMVMEHNDSDAVGMLDHWELTAQETWAKAQALWAAGAEGVVSKRKGSPYIRGRSDDWLKVKQALIAKCTVLDVTSRPDGTMKAMLVKPESLYSGLLPSGTELPKLIAVPTGWKKESGAGIVTNWGKVEDQVRPTPIWAYVAFELTTGETRSVRGARLIAKPAGAI